MNQSETKQFKILKDIVVPIIVALIGAAAVIAAALIGLR